MNKYFKTGFFSQFTDAQIIAQYKKNAEQLAQMVKDAKRKGLKKYRGATVEELEDTAKKYAQFAQGKNIKAFTGR